MDSPETTLQRSSHTLLGIDMQFGYKSAHVKESDVGRAEWYAIGYGCAIIAEDMPLGGGLVSQKRLVVLKGGEPSESLFTAPSSYREVPPSEFDSTVNDALLDKYYATHRPK